MRRRRGLHRRSQLPSYLKSGPSNEPYCAGDNSAGAVRGVVGAVCLQEARQACHWTHLCHLPRHHQPRAQVSNASAPLCISPLQKCAQLPFPPSAALRFSNKRTDLCARTQDERRRAISPICAYTYIYIFLVYLYIYIFRCMQKHALILVWRSLLVYVYTPVTRISWGGCIMLHCHSQARPTDHMFVWSVPVHMWPLCSRMARFPEPTHICSRSNSARSRVASLPPFINTITTSPSRSILTLSGHPSFPFHPTSCAIF